MKICNVILLSCLIGVSSNAQSITSGDTSKVLIWTTDSICVKPDVEATFKKGNWLDFLGNHMTYPREAMRKEIQGTVTVQFVIETDGSVSHVEALYGPEALKDNAARLIMSSPKWTPATRDGKKVRSRKMQPIVYRLTR
jgi:periplasmic protein TonB